MNRRLLPGLAVAALVPLLLTGCSLADAVHRQTSGAVATPHALALGWRTPASQPDWVPADSTGIHYVAATGGAADESPAAVRVTTSSALPSTCTDIERRSIDSFGEDWAPKRFPDTVERCGNWAVMQVPGGWFGWTPLAPSERAGS
jgi:hypothetical protein